MLRGGRSAFVRGLKGGTNEIDGIDGERRASEFREFKEFREFSEALSTFIAKPNC